MSSSPTPDPMQAVAYARITSCELADDAARQAESCHLGRDALRVNAETLATLATMQSYEAAVRFGDHASAWRRESDVWSRLMDHGDQK